MKEKVGDRVFAFTEENDNFIPGYTYCSPNEWGREIAAGSAS
ncbi:hypothetical protein [Thalassomonas actiniarum]|nr:hypothetical protein [Thalassomonas actiniarum]